MTVIRANSSFETVEIVAQPQLDAKLWEPVEGEETQTLLGHLSLPDDDSTIRVRDEAANVLRCCIPPNLPSGNETGLVIGYVQSGKTMSFTTVAALARDNGYRMVIVIAGTSESLFNQSVERLQNDLRLSTRRRWRLFTNPSKNTGEKGFIADTLAEWKGTAVPEAERQSVLIMAMKNHTRLRNLYGLLDDLGDLTGVPTLVVDDEADQASMNTRVNYGEESTTHQHLATLRQKLPNHTFLQYTATPQAPLLINLIDVLSPRFTTLLTPGQDYVGGRTFFIDNPKLIVDIPADEIPNTGRASAALRRSEPPPSLHKAMMLFFVGVAAAYALGETDGKNRSMMVHPSEKQIIHGHYIEWVRKARDEWLRTIALSDNDFDKIDLLSSFKEAHRNLAETVENLPSFDVIIGRLHMAMLRTQVKLINSTPEGKQPIDWTSYSLILVGGTTMDRGFTVKGLTVTYMPRGMGVGNADTIQQRARFFGYKKAYLGYCRVFLEVAVHQAYRHYVRHEDNVHEQLQRLVGSGKSLDEWKRAFYISRDLKPTRSNVLGLDYMRGNYKNRWFTPKAPHDLDAATISNRQVIKDFTKPLDFQVAANDTRLSDSKKHLVAYNVSLLSAYEEFLTLLRITRMNDSQKFTGLLLQIWAYLEEHKDETCTIYNMSGGDLRRRSINNETDNEIPELLQGDPANDDRFRGSQGMTIQIHNLRVLKEDRKTILADNVPAIAIWLPKQMSYDWISQPQGGNKQSL